MDEEFLTKIWLIGPWIIAISIVFVLGLPFAHTVSSMDTVLFNAEQVAMQTDSPVTLTQMVNQEVGSMIPTEMDGKTLFDANFDMIMTTNPTTGEDTLKIIYSQPVFAPFLNLLGMVGPTIPLTFTRTFMPSASSEGGVTYTQ